MIKFAQFPHLSIKFLKSKSIWMKIPTSKYTSNSFTAEIFDRMRNFQLFSMIYVSTDVAVPSPPMELCLYC